MKSAEQDLLKTAEKLESEKLAKIKFNHARITDLDWLLRDAYDRKCPKPIDYHNRGDLIRIFNMIAKEIYGNGENSPVVEEYGSFVMDIFNETSDLDLSINFSKSIEVTRHKQKEILRKFSGKLRSIQRDGHVTGLQSVLSAKVPIIKVTDSGTGIECDLSVNNRDGIVKSHIIRAISAIDERFRKLSFLMKSWAKAHNINSSKDATLNSLSIISFVALHLQTCNPPILPPFSSLLREGADLESVRKIVEIYINYGRQNKDSLAMLFITCLVKQPPIWTDPLLFAGAHVLVLVSSEPTPTLYRTPVLASVENLWQQGLCASSYEGSWISKSYKPSHRMSVEDFTDGSQNVARAVGRKGFMKIYTCIHKSLDYLMQFLNGQIQGTELMELLFETHAVSTLGTGGTSKMGKRKKKRAKLQNPCSPKKIRTVEGLVENLVQRPNGKINSVQKYQRTDLQGMGSVPLPFGKAVQNSLPSFTRRVPYQSPFDNPNTNIKVHHGYGLGNVPTPFGLNPVAFERSYNHFEVPHPSLSQNSGRYAWSSHQNAVPLNPYGTSLTPSSLIRRDNRLYNQRNG